MRYAIVDGDRQGVTGPLRVRPQNVSSLPTRKDLVLSGVSVAKM